MSTASAVVLLVLSATGCRELLGIRDPDLQLLVDAPGEEVDALEPATCLERWMTTPVFGAPVEVTTVNSSLDEDHPFLSPDERTIYYMQGDGIFSAARPDLQTAFGPRFEQGDLLGAQKVFISGDGRTAYFASDRTGGVGRSDIWRGIRPPATGQFVVDQTYLSAVNDAAGQVDPHLSTDLLRMYLATSIGTGNQHIAVATRGLANKDFAAPTTISELATEIGIESGPTLTANELVIVFESTRLGGGGGDDLFYATRHASSERFSDPVPLAQLNSTSIDGSPHVSADGCRVYFMSMRNGTRDLFVASML